MTDIFIIWKAALERVLEKFTSLRSTPFFGLKIILFFIFLNMCSFWVAMSTTIPQQISYFPKFYFFLSLPLSLFGMIFDIISLGITIFLIKKAISTNGKITFLFHIIADIIIAVFTTFWVVYTFSISAWMAHQLYSDSNYPFYLIDKFLNYQSLLTKAWDDPLSNLRNIYIGLLLGISSAIPTFIHFSIFFYSIKKRLFPKGT